MAIEKMYSIKEAQELLGVTKTTLNSWAKKGKIKFVKLGERLVRIPESELKKFIEEGEEK